MIDPKACPECGAVLPSDAPAGLCPRCLMGAAVAGDRTAVGRPGSTVPTDQETVPESAPTGELDRFRRAVLDMGLIRDREFDRFLAGALGGVPGLARALVRAGKLTSYQANAIAQGKVRGLIVGNYLVLDKLGAGGMGVVFKARHRRLGRVVALKILPPNLARDPGLFLRFRREVDVAARLSHPNVVPVLDADEDRGVPFMTMEYIEGNDLDRLVRDGGPLAVDQALDCVIQAARGLEAVHAEGIVHRDIKPGNLMLDRAGVVRVLDLGLARLIEAANPFGETAEGPLTKSGTYMGTVDFMAPEQGIDSSRVDHRADVYSLGCTLCYLLTGRAPFGGDNVLSRLMAHQDQPAPPLRSRRAEVPEAIDSAYRAMIAKRPEQRPGSMAEVIRLLEACRARAGEAEGARSGLRQFAETVVQKRASAPEPSPCETDASERAGAGSTAPVEPGPAAKWSAPGRPVEPRRLRPVALGAGLLAVVAVVGLGAFLFPRGSASPTGADVAAVGEGSRPADPVAGSGPVGVSSGGTTPDRPPVASPSPPPPTASNPPPPLLARPPTSATFDVVTIYAMGSVDRNPEVPIERIAVSGDGTRALISSWTNHAELIDVDAAKNAGISLGPRNGWQGSRPLSMAMTPDGRIAVIGTQKVSKGELKEAKVSREAGILRVVNLKNGQDLLPKKQPYEGDVIAVAISPDGKRALSAGHGGALTLWDLEKNEGQSLFGQDPSASSVGMAFFADGRRAVTTGSDRLVHLWDLDAARELASWKGQVDKFTGLAISPDGRRVVTGDEGGGVILWDVAANQLLHRFDMPANDLKARVAFDPVGNVVTAGHGLDGSPSKPGHLIVWDAKTFEVLRRDEVMPFRHLSLAALPGGRLLTGDLFGLRLWTPRPTGAPARRMPPAATADASPVDLLSLIQPPVHKLSGEWRKSPDGALLTPTTGGWTKLRVPRDLPADYRVEIRVERTGKGDAGTLGLYFPVAGHQAHLVFDKTILMLDYSGRNNPKEGRCSGLDNLHGVLVTSAKAHRGLLLAPAQEARLTLTVRPNSIHLTCGDEVVVNWKGDPRKLIRSLTWRIPDSDELMLGSSGVFAIRQMTLNPLAPDIP